MCINQNAESLNRYFTELASKLINKENVAFDQTKLATIIPEQESDGAFVIKHTTFAELNKFISELRNDCVQMVMTTYQWNSSNQLLKISIDKEIFPASWKLARVFPVPKTGNPIYEKDFQPISTLRVLSKIYEKVILKQLSDYIERTSLYNSTQSGFWKGHSTQTILLKFRDDIQKALNKNEIIMLIFIDYYKALDTIQYETLIKKIGRFEF